MRLLFTCFLLFIVACVKAQLPKIENHELVLDNPVTFKVGTHELTDEGKLALQQVKDFLIAKNYISLLRIEAHSDKNGIEAFLQNQTEKRAMVICLWLINNGIDCKRLIPAGFGSNKPIESHDSPKAKRNQRIVFAIAALNGKLIGGMPADGGGVVPWVCED